MQIGRVSPQAKAELDALNLRISNAETSEERQQAVRDMINWRKVVPGPNALAQEAGRGIDRLRDEWRD